MARLVTPTTRTQHVVVYQIVPDLSRGGSTPSGLASAADRGPCGSCRRRWTSRADHLRILENVLHRRLPAGVKVWVYKSIASWMTKDSSHLDHTPTGGRQNRVTKPVSTHETAYARRVGSSPRLNCVDIVPLCEQLSNDPVSKTWLRGRWSG